MTRLHYDYSRTQRAADAALSADIKETQERTGKRARFCCDGGCNERQGRGDCPASITPEQAREHWSEAMFPDDGPARDHFDLLSAPHLIVYALFVGLIGAVVLSATGTL